MQTTSRPWRSLFNGTLEQWNSTQGNRYMIREERGILSGADLSYRKAAYDKAGHRVAVEYETLSPTTSVVYVL